jgi:Putative neutral zinc metallopeptidase
MSHIARKAGLRGLASLLLAAGALGVAACGSDDNKDTASTAAPKTTTSTSGGATKTAQAVQQPSKASSGGEDAAKAGAKALSGVAVPGKPAGGAKAHIQGSGNLATADFLRQISDDTGSLWQQVFANSKLDFPQATVSIVAAGQQVQSQCNNGQPVTSTGTPLYCPQEKAILLPADFFDQQIKPIGDAAEAYVVAWLWGFHIQNALGLLGQQNMGDAYAQSSDCFAGVYLQTLGGRNLLEQGDIEEVMKVIAAMQDSSAPDAKAKVDKHTAAANKGFTTHNVSDCLPKNFQ